MIGNKGEGSTANAQLAARVAVKAAVGASISATKDAARNREEQGKSSSDFLTHGSSKTC
jgi:hypothetical protein